MAHNPAVGATTSSSALVEVKDVTHRFQRDGNDLVVLRAVSLAIQAGEVTVVLGPRCWLELMPSSALAASDDPVCTSGLLSPVD